MKDPFRLVSSFWQREHENLSCGITAQNTLTSLQLRDTAFAWFPSKDLH